MYIIYPPVRTSYYNATSINYHFLRRKHLNINPDINTITLININLDQFILSNFTESNQLLFYVPVELNRRWFWAIDQYRNFYINRKLITGILSPGALRLNEENPTFNNAHEAYRTVLQTNLHSLNTKITTLQTKRTELETLINSL